MTTSTAIQHHLLSVRDYYRMAEINILTEDDHVELINGELFDMAPIGSFHAGLVTRLSRLLIKNLGEFAIVTACISGLKPTKNSTAVNCIN